MPNPTLRQARQMGMSIYRLMSRSESSTTMLSSGALASIAIAGSVFFFLIVVGPLLIKLARRRGRRQVIEGSITSLSSAEHGQLSQDENFNGPRRLRKRSVVSDGAMYLGMKDARSEGGRDGGGRVARRLSLPVLPPAISRPESFGNEGSGHDANSDRYGNKTRTGADAGTNGGPMYGSPEKRRGHAIYQNRRKTSWIDEDALHGPRVAPKRDTKRKPSWLPGRGLTRTLSRHLSIRRFYAPELNRSPTLPCIETGSGREIVDGTVTKSPESRNAGYANDPPGARELEDETHTQSRFPVRQPLQQGGCLNNPTTSHVQVGGPGPQRASVPSAPSPYSRGYNNTVIGAAQQLAGRAPVPSFDIGVNGQRWSRSQHSNTDKELQAILRRTAERLQDGNRSTRRQTLIPPTSSSPARGPGQTRGGPDQEYRCGGNYAYPGSTASSPTRSQKSAPAVMLHSEPEGCSSRIQQAPSQSGAPWQTHRRTYTREISHVSQVPQVSIPSRPDNLAATPARHRPQADVLHTMLPSPSHSIQTPPPSHPKQELIPRSYSPASEQSSALSTVYSEEEDDPPISAPQAENIPEGGGEMERQAMAQALRASGVFSAEQTQRGDAGTSEGTQERRGDLQASHGSRPLHEQNRTLERVFPSGAQTAAPSPSGRQYGIEHPAVRLSPQATPAIQNLQAKTPDPFTTCTTPNRLTPQRLSRVFSPLPVKLPGDAMSPCVDLTESHSGTPTPSPSRGRVFPPPHRLRPGANSPTLGLYHDSQFQIQTPSRVPSPVESESGLSSVYDSYRYSRYSDSVEGSQTLTRLSATTMLTVPPTEVSPTKSRWDQTPLPPTSTDSQTGDRGTESGGVASRAAHVRLNNALSGARAYTHSVGPLEFSTMENGPARMGYAAEEALPRFQPHRDITCSTVSCLSGESTYSQDEDGGDKLAPLMPIYSATAASGKHTSRVMNAVAELRRMNSQVSCVSAYSTATTAVTSPTLPALRGGGCSPGKKGTVGAAKNYFSLGNSPRSGEGEGEYGYEERRRLDNEAQDEETTAPVEIGKELGDEYTLHKGGIRRSQLVVESYEQDLDRARQLLRQSRGYSLRSIREVSNALGSGG